MASAEVTRSAMGAGGPPRPMRRCGIGRHLWRACISMLIVNIAHHVLVADAATVSKREQSYVEVRVQDFSFTDGVRKAPSVAVESKDISASEINAILAQKMGGRMPTTREQQQAAIDTEHDRFEPPSSSSPMTAPEMIAAIEQELHELSRQELAMIMVVLGCSVCLLGLVVVSTCSLVRYAWRSYRERRLVRCLVTEADAQRLSYLIESQPILNGPLRQLALLRLHHLEYANVVKRLCTEVSGIRLDHDELKVYGLPVGPQRQPMTLVEVIRALEQVRCKGDRLVHDMMGKLAQKSWRRYMRSTEMLDLQQKLLGEVNDQLLRVQNVALDVADVLEQKLQRGEGITRNVLMGLLDALRDSTATGVSTHAGPTQSPTTSPQGVKDEFQFLIKTFEELCEHEEMKATLQQTLEGYQQHVQLRITHETHLIQSEEQTAQLDQSDASPQPAEAKVAQQGSLFGHSGLMWTQRLETVVNRAEVLEITHLDEVESAQYLLEETERQKFCAKMCSNDATAAESVDALARSLVALGADHKHAVLKASEIYANRANTMLLIDSLRSCFNEVRKRDLMKMEERRRRHREKQSDKRERIADKFRMKRQVLAERMEQTRILQREKEEAENRAKLRVELEEKRRLEKAERKQWVSFVTKVDMVVVLLVMVVVFSEHLLDHELFRPVCHPDDSQRSMLSWWTTNSFSTFGCHFKYGLKMTGILVGIIAFFFVCAQLQLLNLAIPLAMGMLLYQVRAGWMNMMLRLPLVLVLYGFNQSILYVLNHSERPEVSEGDNVRTTRLVAKAQRKRRWLLLHVLFPVASLVLSGVTSIVIACDAPQECVATGSQALASGWDLVADMLREAYHLKN